MRTAVLLYGSTDTQGYIKEELCKRIGYRKKTTHSPHVYTERIHGYYIIRTPEAFNEIVFPPLVHLPTAETA